MRPDMRHFPCDEQKQQGMASCGHMDSQRVEQSGVVLSRSKNTASERGAGGRSDGNDRKLVHSVADRGMLKTDSTQRVAVPNENAQKLQKQGKAGEATTRGKSGRYRVSGTGDVVATMTREYCKRLARVSAAKSEWGTTTIVWGHEYRIMWQEIADEISALLSQSHAANPWTWDRVTALWQRSKAAAAKFLRALKLAKAGHNHRLTESALQTAVRLSPKPCCHDWNTFERLLHAATGRSVSEELQESKADMESSDMEETAVQQGTESAMGPVVLPLSPPVIPVATSSAAKRKRSSTASTGSAQPAAAAAAPSCTPPIASAGCQSSAPAAVTARPTQATSRTGHALSASDLVLTRLTQTMADMTDRECVPVGDGGAVNGLQQVDRCTCRGKGVREGSVDSEMAFITAKMNQQTDEAAWLHMLDIEVATQTDARVRAAVRHWRHEAQSSGDEAVEVDRKYLSRIAVIMSRVSS